MWAGTDGVTFVQGLCYHWDALRCSQPTALSCPPAELHGQTPPPPYPDVLTPTPGVWGPAETSISCMENDLGPFNEILLLRAILMVLGLSCASQGPHFAGGGGKVDFGSLCPLASCGCSGVMVDLIRAAALMIIKINDH